ncbi:MAG: hypothetical protein AAB870_03810 [Patescibacteria group bacterium]
MSKRSDRDKEIWALGKDIHEYMELVINGKCNPSELHKIMKVLLPKKDVVLEEPSNHSP